MRRREDVSLGKNRKGKERKKRGRLSLNLGSERFPV